MDDWAIVALFVGIALAGAIGSAANDMADSRIAEEASKAGLQQCLIEGTHSQLAWQKECK